MIVINRMAKVLGALLLVGALSTTAAAATSGNAAAGAAKSRPCAACHGMDGDQTIDGQYPRLAGPYADYLLHALQQYKNGRRDNAIMAGFVKDLSTQDMADLAAFYAAQAGRLEDLSHLK